MTVPIPSDRVGVPATHCLSLPRSIMVFMVFMDHGTYQWCEFVVTGTTSVPALVAVRTICSLSSCRMDVLDAWTSCHRLPLCGFLLVYRHACGRLRLPPKEAYFDWNTRESWTPKHGQGAQRISTKGGNAEVRRKGCSRVFAFGCTF